MLFLLPCAAAQTAPLFRENAVAAGLNFHHFTGATGEYFLPEIMGAGTALFDYDNDGDLDVYLMQGTLLDPQRKLTEAKFPPPKSWQPGNRLLRNEFVPTGKLQFTDVSKQAGLNYIGYGMGAATGDYDNDGFVDIYLTNFGANVLYHNNGNGTFSEVTATAGVNDDRWSTSASWFDADRDGDLDLFVCNYVDFTLKNNKRCYTPTGELDYCAPASYQPVPDRLFRNEGNGKFTDVSQRAGIHRALGPGLGVTAADFNGDGWQDLYVANDGAANHLWLNQRDGTFKEEGLLAGAAYSMDGIARAGMGVTAGDIDNDGDDDLLITNLTRQGSTLQLNDGKAFFTDASLEFNVAQPSFLFTGFGVQWFDYDNDGWLDLFAANGAVTLLPALRGQRYPFHQRNQLFHNEAGKRFVETSAQGGTALQLSEVSRGAAFGDIDNDGDVDILVTNNNGPTRLLLNTQNDSKNKRMHWLSLQLQGTKDNRQGLGAYVGILCEGLWQWRRVHSDGSYLSASDTRVHFGLGRSSQVESLVVRWPGGSRERWEKIEIDRIRLLRQGSGILE